MVLRRGGWDTASLSSLSRAEIQASTFKAHLGGWDESAFWCGVVYGPFSYGSVRQRICLRGPTSKRTYDGAADLAAATTERWPSSYRAPVPVGLRGN